MDSLRANTDSLQAALKAELEQLDRKYGSLLEKHQALLKHFKPLKEMMVRAFKLSLIIKGF
jgi:hypothetical protein